METEEKKEAEEIKSIFSQNLLFFRKKLNFSQKCEKGCKIQPFFSVLYGF